MTKNTAAVMCLAVGVVGGLVTPHQAWAQQRVMVTRSLSSGGEANGAISRKSLDKWSITLGLGAEQAQAAQSLHEGYLAEHQASAKEMQTAMRDINRSFEDTKDHSVFEKIPEVTRKHSERAKSLEKTFMGDLKSLLSPEQEPAWGKVERMRRREIGTRFSSVSGDTVDLAAVLEGLKLPEATMALMAQPLEAYETEFDRAVQDRIRISAEEFDSPRGGPIDVEKLQKRMESQREAALKLKSINERHARKLGPLLPEDKQQAFADAVRLQTYPRVYRPSHITKQLDAAAALSDLDSDQKETLAQLAAQYEREVGPLNDAWAAAIEQDEASANNGVMGGAGGVMMLRMGDENEALAEARKARRELDERIRDRMNRVLRPEQQDRLPKPAEEQEGVMMFAPAGGVVIGG